MVILKINTRIPKTYQINESGIVISTYSNPKLPAEEHIKFENIKQDRFYYVQRNYQYLIVAGIALIILVFIVAQSVQEKLNYRVPIILFSVIMTVFCSLFFILQPKVYFIKTFTGKYIKFKVNDNETEIDAFVKTLFEKRNAYLKLKFGNPTQYLSYDAQYSNFNIMLKENILSIEDYKEKMDELNRIFNQTAPQKSFLGYSQN